MAIHDPRSPCHAVPLLNVGASHPKTRLIELASGLAIFRDRSMAAASFRLLPAELVYSPGGVWGFLRTRLTLLHHGAICKSNHEFFPNFPQGANRPAPTSANTLATRPYRLPYATQPMAIDTRYYLKLRNTLKESCASFIRSGLPSSWKRAIAALISAGTARAWSSPDKLRTRQRGNPKGLTSP